LTIALLVGVILAVVVGIFGRLTGFDRDKAFYATVLVVVASYYGLYAVIGASREVLLQECAVIAIFVVLAVLGFKGRPWLVVAGLAGHGVMDSFHGRVISNPGVPDWWPYFCGAYDVAAAVFLAGLILIGSKASATQPERSF
jgi:hypothetical protein